MINVFLVDDEYYVRTSLKENIPWEENGFIVIGEANNGKTAYQKILECRPDLAIVDINMPGYNGIELITMLTEVKSECIFVILTGYDEFKYAQQAIKLGVHEYILKPIDYDLFIESLIEIKKEIEEQTGMSEKIQTLEKQNKRYLFDIYYNDLVNCNLAAFNMNKYDDSFLPNLYLPYKNFTVIIFEFCSNILLLNLEDIREELLQAANQYQCVSCLDSKHRLFFILDSSLENQVEKFITLFKNEFCLKNWDVTIGVGTCYSCFEQIYLSYNEACIALQNSGIMKSNPIYYIDLENSKIVPPICSQTKNFLKVFILKGKLEDITKLITQFYDTLINQITTFHLIILHTLELLNVLIEVLSTHSPLPVSLLHLNGNVFDQLNQMSNPTAIRDWILNIYIDSIKSIIIQPTLVSDITKQIETYILEHYSDPQLSIPQISQELYLSYSYICYCFKRDKNVSINDYLNQIRIEKAIELFHNQVDNICYVSEKIGFNNPGYFSKRFKKAVGLSPSEYIKTLSNEIME